MPLPNLKLNSHLDLEQRRAVLSLRWLLVILASCLTLFSTIGSPTFVAAAVLALTFGISNAGFMVIPRQKFVELKLQRILAILDVVFISAFLYLLRVSQNYLYIAFIAAMRSANVFVIEGLAS